MISPFYSSDWTSGYSSDSSLSSPPPGTPTGPRSMRNFSIQPPRGSRRPEPRRSNPAGDLHFQRNKSRVTPQRPQRVKSGAGKANPISAAALLSRLEHLKETGNFAPKTDSNGANGIHLGNSRNDKSAFTINNDLSTHNYYGCHSDHHPQVSMSPPASPAPKHNNRAIFTPGTIVIAQDSSPAAKWLKPGPNVVNSSFGPVYVKKRPYVVIHQDAGDSCTVLPIYTHRGQGLDNIKQQALRNPSEYAPSAASSSSGSDSEDPELTNRRIVDEATNNWVSLRDASDPNPRPAETSRGFLRVLKEPRCKPMHERAALDLSKHQTLRYDADVTIVGHIVSDDLEKLMLHVAEHDVSRLSKLFNSMSNHNQAFQAMAREFTSNVELGIMQRQGTVEYESQDEEEVEEGEV